MGGWPIMSWSVGRCCGGSLSPSARVFMDDRRVGIYTFGIGLAANAGLVRLTLFASDMSKGTVSAAMGML